MKLLEAKAYAEALKERGYVEVPAASGKKCMPSECADHCRVTGKTSSVVLVSPNGQYAYVLFTDLTWGDGTWHQFQDGSFTLG